MLVIKLKANFLNNIPNKGMFKTANISLALLYVGKDNFEFSAIKPQCKTIHGRTIRLK